MSPPQFSVHWEEFCDFKLHSCKFLKGMGLASVKELNNTNKVVLLTAISKNQLFTIHVCVNKTFFYHAICTLKK